MKNISISYIPSWDIISDIDMKRFISLTPLAKCMMAKNMIEIFKERIPKKGFETKTAFLRHFLKNSRHLIVCRKWAESPKIVKKKLFNIKHAAN